MIREFFLGFIKLHILYHASCEPVYGLELIRELARHGYDISPGTLYPLLHKLERLGYLKQEHRLINGKVRKYYSTTSQGRRALTAARAKVVELVSEVLREPGLNVLHEKSKKRADRLDKRSRSVPNHDPER